MKHEIYYVLVFICIGTHIIRAGYEIIKSRKIIKPGRLSFTVIFIDMLVLWISWFLICRYDFHEIHFPGIIRYLAIILAFAGVIIFLSGLFTIKTLESYDGDLITTGIYSVIRHPMYLGFILWLSGFPVYFESLMPLILSAFFIMNVLFWRHLEEKELVHRFPFYMEYRKKTIF